MKQKCRRIKQLSIRSSQQQWGWAILLALTMYTGNTITDHSALEQKSSRLNRAQVSQAESYSTSLQAMPTNTTTNSGNRFNLPELSEIQGSILTRKEPVSPLGRNSLTDTDGTLWFDRIKTILFDHWETTNTTPIEVNEDLEAMASYFSQFPAVRQLFSSIGKRQWTLKYEEKTYETLIRGSQLSVDSITVFFDPRSAAQFKFYRSCTNKIPYCVASPADVLLHELLHVRTIANNPDHFIAQGGMSRLMYPYQHEIKTIEAEKQLYQSMTAIDGQPRPLRNEHTGRHVLAACVTCLQ